MPVPTVYTENTFALYLVDTLDRLADVLVWDGQNPRVREAVNDALLDYGGRQNAPAIATITGGANIRHLRKFGERAIWRAVARATAGNYSFTDVAAQKFDRQQVHDHAITMLALAETDCLEFSAAYVATVVIVRHQQDPYAVIPDEERLP